MTNTFSCFLAFEYVFLSVSFNVFNRGICEVRVCATVTQFHFQLNIQCSCKQTLNVRAQTRKFNAKSIQRAEKGVKREDGRRREK